MAAIRFNWSLFPAIAAAVFAPRPEDPLPIWAQKHVRLDSRMTSRPGQYDPNEYPATWEFQEIFRTRHVWEQEIEPGVTIIIDQPERAAANDAVFLSTEKLTRTRVHQIDVMKSTQSGFTEAALNGVRWMAVNDPKNIIFAIDNRAQAGEVNEIRLQRTLKNMGEKFQIFTGDVDDESKFTLKLRRMIIYFLGSYSAGAFAQKNCEVGINDELEEHGTPNSVDDLRSRMKSYPNRLLINMSKPQDLLRDAEDRIVGGPIAREHARGSMHVLEVPCPHCSEEQGKFAGYQELRQENMKFSHCKNLMEEWDFQRVLTETFFECVHCHKPITEDHKRWMNDRAHRRWRRTNFRAEPNHISFQVSDFLSYDDSVSWGRLAIEYIKSKGDPVKRKAYRNHHQGLPQEKFETKTELKDILLLRGPYKRGQMPWPPAAVILGADVGLTYVKWAVYAFRRSLEWGDGECAVVDWGLDLHPDDISRRMDLARYECTTDSEKYGISQGVMDSKYRRIEVHLACLRLPKRLYPSAGIRAGISMRSISFNRPPNRPAWFGVIVYNDDDAKSELYTDRLGAWSHWKKINEPPDQKPLTPRIWLPEDINSTDRINGYAGKEFLEEHTRENMVGMANGRFEWKRKGANEGGDCTKVACMAWRFYMLGQEPLDATSQAAQAAEIAEAINV